MSTGNRFELGPSLAYNLDLFGGVRRSIESQRAATASVRDQVLNTYVTLVDQVVITAFDYAATLEQIEVTQALIDELRDQFDLTQALENAGKITRSDTLQAQTQLENVRATLPGLEQQRDTYRNALAQLSGTDARRSSPLPSLSLKDFALPAELPASLPSDLVRRDRIFWRRRTSCTRPVPVSAWPKPRACPRSASPLSTRNRPRLSANSSRRPGGIWSVGADLAARRYSTAARSRRANTRPRSSTGRPKRLIAAR